MRPGGRRRPAGPGSRIGALRRLRPGAHGAVSRICEKAGASVNGNLRVTSRPAALADATFVVEAIVEDHDAKAALMAELSAPRSPTAAILATTTSSLSIERARARRAGGPSASSGCTCSTRCRRWTWSSSRSRPRPRDDTRARAHALCEALGKTAVEVPDTPGFVVNRLLFPFLFEAVRLMEARGSTPRRSTPACSSAPATRWGRSRCSTSWASTSGRDRPHDRRRGARADRADDRGGRARTKDQARVLRLRLSPTLHEGATKCLAQD